jgi:FkbM family methyltransferase
MLSQVALELLALSLRRIRWQGVRWRLIPFALRLAQASLPQEEVRDVTTRSGFRMRVRLGDWLGRHVFVRGEYEPETAKVIDALLRPGDSFADVGANAGYFTLLASRRVGRRGRVIAFEPVPVTREELLTNVRLNRACNITVFDRALSNASGQATFSIGPTDHRGTSSFRPLTDESALITVETARLDDLLPAEQKVHVIKIDVEGAEQMALEGMRDRLGRDTPDLIIEITDQYLRSLGNSAVALCELLSGLGYRMYAITYRGLVPFEPPAAASCPQYNALFTMRDTLPHRLRVVSPHPNRTRLAELYA